MAFLILTYGWAKIIGSQFTILDSEVDKPLGEVSGFWLTWYYFGFSHFYGNFIALVQITCGFLLLYRRTVLIGTSVLFGVVGNIVLIDIFYGVDTGALIVAVLLEFALLLILNFHRQELLELFWTRQNYIFSNIKTGSSVRVVKYVMIALFIILPPSCTYYIANYNNRMPTEIDGAWQVISTSEPVVDGTEPLTKIFFEQNRIFMTVFRFGDDKWIEHHFEIDRETTKSIFGKHG